MINCEKCGRQVRSLANEYSNNYYTIGMNWNGYFVDSENPLRQSYIFDLCPKCAGEVLDFVTGEPLDSAKNGKQ